MQLKINDRNGVDITNDQYHAIEAISPSALKLIDRSPLHYWSRYRDPNREPVASTPAQKIGTAIHCAILEPAEFANRYDAMPEGLDRRTKEGKAIYNAIIASGKEALPEATISEIWEIARSVREMPVSKVVFGQAGGVREKSFFWRDPTTGVLCKMRPDYFVPPCAQFPNGLIVDVKKTVDASPVNFPRSFINYKMYLQSAFYADGIQEIFETEGAPQFLWLAIEDERPFAAKFFQATPEIQAHGRRECARLTNIYAECESANAWNGYGFQVEPLKLPAWAERQFNDAENAP